MPEIVVNNVWKTFLGKEGNVNALKNVSLEIEKGDIFGIIGMSGAGKSTLVRCLNFLEKPDLGDVIIEDNNLKALSEKELRRCRKKIAMIFQHFNLLMQKNVIDNVCFPLLIQGVRKKEAILKAKELLEIVGLTDKAKAYPAQLSGGQKQRVAIARALASSPSILLCDEATSALDPDTTSSILSLLKDINEKMNITIVMITHQMSVVNQICKNVAIMSDGIIIENGSVEDIFTHPKSEITKKLIFGRTESKETSAIEKNLTEITADATVLRVVYSSNPSGEPLIANMVLKFQEPVSILYANTCSIGGIAKGEMLIELPKDTEVQKKMINYLVEHNLEIEEVKTDVYKSN